ncbi:MAG: DUF188 domain-containing protein [Candidatus Sumerlaeia bacterium]|nr:DUF188 domain-containing protein [Candidatus Sumerlaeia bacterium]
MKIIVDADACPVMREVISVAEQFNVPVWFIADYSHSFEWDSSLVTVRLVDDAVEAVDIYVVNLAQSGDIVITQDLGLASLVVSKKAYVLTPRGKLLKHGKMEMLLERRHQARKLRRAGVRLKGGSPRLTQNERSRFVSVLTNLIQSLSENPTIDRDNTR